MPDLESLARELRGKLCLDDICRSDRGCGCLEAIAEALRTATAQEWEAAAQERRRIVALIEAKGAHWREQEALYDKDGQPELSLECAAQAASYEMLAEEIEPAPSHKDQKGDQRQEEGL